jgi:hypothetical protein
MTTDRNTSQAPGTWRTRAGIYGFAAVAALGFGATLATISAPVTVEARMEAQVPDPCDFATSGGFVVNPLTGKKANFGVHGGCKNGAFWGHLNFVDHANGYHVNSVEVTAYLAPNGVEAPVRDVCGIAQTNNPADPEFVYFRARLIDNGEPGGADQFGLLLGPAGGAATYQVPPAGTLDQYGMPAFVLTLGTARPGGNVQLHSPNPSTVVLPGVDEAAACGGLTFNANPPE